MSGEKTEKPTKKKLDDAKKKGQVAVSKDVQILAKLIVFYGLVFMSMGPLSGKLSNVVNQVIGAAVSGSNAIMADTAKEVMYFTVIVLVVIALVCALASSVFTWIQTGFVVAPEALTPSFKKFNVVENIKNMFSKKSLIQLILSVVKVCILFTVMYFVLKGHLEEVTYIYRGGLSSLLTLLVYLSKLVLFYGLGLFIVLSVLDWVVTYFNHLKSLKMSKQDLKDEYKQSEGDPHMKSERKQEHKRILNSSLSSMGSAKAVVANPTHISVALDYEPGVHDLPFILMMGTDEEALAMREEAKRLNIPVITNIKLARSIHSTCQEQEYIRTEHIELAAQVFKQVFEIMAQRSAAQPQQNHPM